MSSPNPKQTWSKRIGGGYKFGSSPMSNSGGVADGGDVNDEEAVMQRTRAIERYIAACTSLGEHPVIDFVSALTDDGVHSDDEAAATCVLRQELSALQMRCIANALGSDRFIRTFDVESCSLGAESTAELAVGLQQNETLTHVVLSGNNVGSAGLASLAAALRNNSKSTIRVVELDDCAIGDDGVARLASVLGDGGTVQLRRLSLARNLVTCKGAVALGNALEKCTNADMRLQTVVLSRNRIGDAGMEALAAAIAANRVQELYVDGNTMSARCMLALSDSLSGGALLSVLDVSENSIGDEGALLLSDGVARAPYLHTLRVAHAHLSEQGVCALLDATAQSECLRLLDLGGAAVGSRDGAASLVHMLKSDCCELRELRVNVNELVARPDGGLLLTHIAEAMNGNCSLCAWDCDVRFLLARGQSQASQALRKIGTSLRMNLLLTRLNVLANKHSSGVGDAVNGNGTTAFERRLRSADELRELLSNGGMLAEVSVSEELEILRLALLDRVKVQKERAQRRTKFFEGVTGDDDVLEEEKEEEEAAAGDAAVHDGHEGDGGESVPHTPVRRTTKKSSARVHSKSKTRTTSGGKKRVRVSSGSASDNDEDDWDSDVENATRARSAPRTAKRLSFVNDESTRDANDNASPKLAEKGATPQHSTHGHTQSNGRTVSEHSDAHRIRAPATSADAADNADARSHAALHDGTHRSETHAVDCNCAESKQRIVELEEAFASQQQIIEQLAAGHAKLANALLTMRGGHIPRLVELERQMNSLDSDVASTLSGQFSELSRRISKLERLASQRLRPLDVYGLNASKLSEEEAIDASRTLDDRLDEIRDRVNTLEGALLEEQKTSLSMLDAMLGRD